MKTDIEWGIDFEDEEKFHDVSNIVPIDDEVVTDSVDDVKKDFVYKSQNPFYKRFADIMMNRSTSKVNL